LVQPPADKTLHANIPCTFLLEKLNPMEKVLFNVINMLEQTSSCSQLQSLANAVNEMPGIWHHEGGMVKVSVPLGTAVGQT
jgi:hypothetical protein